MRKRTRCLHFVTNMLLSYDWQTRCSLLFLMKKKMFNKNRLTDPWSHSDNFHWRSRKFQVWVVGLENRTDVTESISMIFEKLFRMCWSIEWTSFLDWTTSGREISWRRTIIIHYWTRNLHIIRQKSQFWHDRFRFRKGKSIVINDVLMEWSLFVAFLSYWSMSSLCREKERSKTSGTIAFHGLWFRRIFISEISQWSSETIATFTTWWTSARIETIGTYDEKQVETERRKEFIGYHVLL